MVQIHGFEIRGDLTMDEVFRLYIILVMGLLRKEVRMMVHIIPRIIEGGHGFHDVFIRMEDGGTGERETT